MKLVQPSEELAVIVGDEPVSPAQVVEELWGYIRENGLQDAKNPRRIRADDDLRSLLGGKDQVTVLELARLIGKHLSAGSEGVAVPDEELGREFEEQVLASSYETLGCSREMSDEELERKYRELSREYHPDRPGRRGDSRWNRQAGRGKVPGDSERLRRRGDIPELIPVSSVSPASWGTVKKEVGRWEDF